jgi:hypothetical protein
MRKWFCKLIATAGLNMCEWLLPRMRQHPDISYDEYMEAVRLHKSFKVALHKITM